MMKNWTELKEQDLTDTPVLLFECVLASGLVERWSTNRVISEGQQYEARILRHSLFEVSSGSSDGIDAFAKIVLTLSNADSHLSQIERGTGFKGSKITARLGFFDLKLGAPTSETIVLFKGIADSPDEITESSFRLTVNNRLSLQRVLLPDVRVQKRCPWKFPSTPSQREEACDGGTKGRYSPFFRCGYSPEVQGGAGNLAGDAPYTGCTYSRADCEQRGMFAEDSSGRQTRRFGGIEFVPSSIIVRSYGEKGQHVSAPVENAARYNDFLPLVYGTVWYAPLLVFARNDGNLTRMEAVLGMGEMEGVLKVVVNGVDVPPGRSGVNMTSTGWYKVITPGTRTGAFNSDFTDGTGRAAGDPYGSVAVLSVVVPNRVNEGRSLPRVEVLVNGLKVPHFGLNGTPTGERFSSNPSWIILDLLLRSGWDLSEIDVPSFAKVAEYCDETIEATDLSGTSIQIPRFQCNLALTRRRSASDVIRGIRNGSSLFLTYGLGGQLKLSVEGRISVQQAEKPEGSNSTTQYNGGWPAYEFGDGSNGFSSILRKANGEPSVHLWSRSIAESPNRFTAEFQDSFNEFQQDSMSLLDVDDAIRTGQEISSALPALGLANANQAARALNVHLRKSVSGNTYLEFESSVRALGLKPGDIITFTYLKEGFQQQAFRVIKLAPSENFRTIVITAQIHDDAWYDDHLSGVPVGLDRREYVNPGLPRPITGPELGPSGHPQFAISETYHRETSGATALSLTAKFCPPRRPERSQAGHPVLAMTAEVNTAEGSLDRDQTLFYAVSGLDGDGLEGPLSFTIPVYIPAGSNTNSVRLGGLAFDQQTHGFRIYRGDAPNRLLQIATAEGVASEFLDSGLPWLATLPPDPNYDHANFYWRLEIMPEYSATIYGIDRIGKDTLDMDANKYGGAMASITGGTGKGQERAITENDANSFKVTPEWDTIPDGTSRFVIVEAAWHPGAASASDTVTFDVPNREGATVQIAGRSANVHDRECAPELSPLTRWRVRGNGAPFDSDVPPKPSFGFMSTGEGRLEVAGISFPTLTNTRTIRAGTLTLHFWNELLSPTKFVLADDVGAEGDEVVVSAFGGAQPGDLIQIGAEVMRVVEVAEDGARYQVERGLHNTSAEGHTLGSCVYRLEIRTLLLPFVRDFFGSPVSGDYAFPISLPDVRIATAELVMTNECGSGEPGYVALTATADCGLRTLSGGQFSIQVDGTLAIQTNAAPPLVIQATHSVRDVFAMMSSAPVGAPTELLIREGEQEYCRLTIPAGAEISNVVNGFGLRPLTSGSQLKLDVLSVGQAPGTTPGRDLTVSIQL